MGVEELINRYLEETNILEDDNVQTIIVYGSRVTNQASCTSDLDVLVITTSNMEFRKACMIDGINVETTYVPDHFFYSNILTANLMNNTYYESVFSTGIILKDENNLVPKFIDYIEEIGVKEKTKKSMSQDTRSKIYEYLHHYKNTSGTLNEYYYYNLVELIRNAYHYLNNHSYVNQNKLYKIYSNPTLGEEVYKLDLPDADFRELFFRVLEEKENKDEIIKELLKSIDYVESIDDIGLYRSKREFLSTNQIKKILVSLYKCLCKLEDVLIYSNQMADYLYFVSIKAFQKYYLEIYHFTSEEFEELFEKAIVAKDTNERITLMEEMFALIEGDYHFDYDDYTLKLN